MTSPHTTHLSEALDVIAAARESYPDSRHLALTYAQLLAQCGQDQLSLDACESFLVNFGVDDHLLELALELRTRIGALDTVKSADTTSISLCMIVKNEAINLPACLASLKPVVDEMIIADTGSTDRTVDIAVVFGAKVERVPWNGNFSDARNFSLEHAHGAWILVMDADEVLSVSDYDSVRLATNGSGQQVVWNVLTRNYTNRHVQGWNSNDGNYPTEERGCGWHASRKVRFFPKNKMIRFRGEVHELVETSAEEIGFTIKEATFVVHHYGGLVEQPEGATPKQLAYFQLGKEKLSENPDDLIAIGELAVQASELKLFEEAIELWDRFLSFNPDATVALFNKGFALMMLNRFHEALAISEKVLNLEPDHKEAAFNYGTCVLYVGEPANSLLRLEKLQKIHPKHPPLLAILTLLYLFAGQREKAVFTFSTLKSLNYAISDYARARANVLNELGKTDSARRLLDECSLIGMDVK